MRFLLLTGMSGAGKTTALRTLEDMGVFCVDNLPPMLLVRVMDAFRTSGSSKEMAAFSVDVRSGAFFDAKAILDAQLEMQHLGYHLEVLFLEASDERLVARYKETRREHPLSGDDVSLTEAIAQERNLLQPLRERADYVIDTTDIKSKALQKELKQIVSGGKESSNDHLHIEVMSFGFKRGLPRQADLVFDVRFLPNPFYIPELCRHSGLDEDVRSFVLGHDVTREFLDRTCSMLDFLMPHYQEEGKHRLVIAIGCTGGAHRSVAIAEAIAAWLRIRGCRVDCNHRDLDIEQARWLDVPEVNG